MTADLVLRFSSSPVKPFPDYIFTLYRWVLCNSSLGRFGTIFSSAQVVALLHCRPVSFDLIEGWTSASREAHFGAGFLFEASRFSLRETTAIRSRPQFSLPHSKRFVLSPKKSPLTPAHATGLEPVPRRRADNRRRRTWRATTFFSLWCSSPSRGRRRSACMRRAAQLLPCPLVIELPRGPTMRMCGAQAGCWWGRLTTWRRGAWCRERRRRRMGVPYRRDADLQPLLLRPARNGLELFDH